MEKEKIGTMRFDFADGDNNLCNKYFPYANITQEEIDEIQPMVNDIMFARFKSFDNIIEYCRGTGYDKTKSLTNYTENFEYVTKITPVRGDYNGHILITRR